MKFLRQSRAVYDAEDILQIDPSSKIPKPVYIKPNASDAEESVMTPDQLFDILEKTLRRVDGT